MQDESKDPLAAFKYDLKAAYVGANDLEATHADNLSTIEAWNMYGHITDLQVYVLRQYNDYLLSSVRVQQAFKDHPL